MELPKKNETVSLEWLEEFCAENNLNELWAKIKNDPPKRPFKSDGCSWWPDEWRAISGELVSIYKRCLIHDLHYWAGYSEKAQIQERVARFVSDAEFVIGVVRDTKRVELGLTMFLGVRSGGGSEWRMPFSWGFGRKL